MYNVEILETKNTSLLEAVSPRRRKEAIRQVFAPLRASERNALASDPVEVGFRAEAILAGAPLEDTDEGSAAYADDCKTFARIVPPILRKLSYRTLRVV